MFELQVPFTTRSLPGRNAFELIVQLLPGFWPRTVLKIQLKGRPIFYQDTDRVVNALRGAARRRQKEDNKVEPQSHKRNSMGSLSLCLHLH
jgi:hypothetical protein